MAANATQGIYRAPGMPGIPLQYETFLGTVTGLQTNGTGLFSIPTAGTYYAYRFRFLTGAGVEVTQAQSEAEITNISIRVNGDLVIDAKTSELNMLQGYYGDSKGAAIVPGITVIDLVRSNALTAPGEKTQYAWGTKGVDSIQCQFQCGTLTNVASIEVYAVQTDEDRPMGTHLRILPTTASFPSTGDFTLPDLPKDPGTAYLAAHVGLGAGTLKNTTLTIDNVRIYGEIPPKIEQQRLEWHGRNPQTGFFHLDFCLYNEILGYLPMVRNNGGRVQDIRLKTNWTVAPGNHRILTERIFGLPAVVAA